MFESSLWENFHLSSPCPCVACPRLCPAIICAQKGCKTDNFHLTSNRFLLQVLIPTKLRVMWRTLRRKPLNFWKKSRKSAWRSRLPPCTRRVWIYLRAIADFIAAIERTTLLREKYYLSSISLGSWTIYFGFNMYLSFPLLLYRIQAPRMCCCELLCLWQMPWILLPQLYELLHRKVLSRIVLGFCFAMFKEDLVFLRLPASVSKRIDRVYLHQSEWDIYCMYCSTLIWFLANIAPSSSNFQFRKTILCTYNKLLATT